MGIPTIGRTGELLPLPPVASICIDLRKKVSQEEALEKFKWKVERDLEIKVLGEVNVEFESSTKKLREKLSQEEDALEEFHSTLDNDSLGTEVDWQNDLLHETKDFFVRLDQSIQVVVVQNNVQQEVAREIAKSLAEKTIKINVLEVYEESRSRQKNVLKHQFENFSTASNESLDKAYDRFQKLISQLEVHGAPISKEDINQKFLRNIDEIDIDDLYNNLRVYEDEMKRSSSSTSTSQNLAFLSSENTSSTNEVSTASGDFGVSTAGGISQVSSTPCAHDVACSFFAQPTTSPQLENEDFQQIGEDDLKELDLRSQVAMLTIRVRKFIQKTGRNMDFKEK
ncbi:hypothetical protein Tco_0015203 [Tanacetum coccineum]